MTIKAIFCRTYLYTGDPEDMRRPYHICIFNDVYCEDGRHEDEFSTKRTRLLEEARLKKNECYEIIFGDRGFPIEVRWGTSGEKVYLKNHNSIIKVDKNGKEVNLSANTMNQKVLSLLREKPKSARKSSKEK